MVTVYFHGSLKQEFGSRFDMHVATPADALRGLLMQIKGLQEKIRTGTFFVRLNGQMQTEQTIQTNFRQPEEHAVVHIVPRVAGAGKNGQIIAGVVLIVVGAVMASWGNPYGYDVIRLGVGLTLGGIAQKLTKTPSLERKGQDARNNTNFSNIDNTIAQGSPVPIAYGLVYCGSRVISQGVESRRVDVQKPELQDPVANNLSLDIKRSSIAGVAATDPQGRPYRTDFGNDSVKAHNYQAMVEEQAISSAASSNTQPTGNQNNRLASRG